MHKAGNIRVQHRILRNGGSYFQVSSILLMDHPVKTLLYELFVEPVLRLLQRATMKGQFPWKAA